MSKLIEVLKKRGEVDRILIGGANPIELETPVFNNLIVAEMTKQFSDRIIFDYKDGTANFDDRADLGKLEDSIILKFQIPHNAYTGKHATLMPHFHWLQENESLPVLQMEYRILNIGKDAKDWEKLEGRLITHFEYKGKPLHQVTSLPEIAIEDMVTSSIVELRVWRDGHSDHIGEFLKVFSFDAHLKYYLLGSNTEFEV